MIGLRRDILPLLTLALPLVLAQLAQTSMGFVDTLMVGRLGNEALAGIALGSIFFHFIQIVLSGVLFAVNPMVSQAFGAARDRDVGRAVRQGLWLASLLAIPAIFLFYLAEPILVMMGQDVDTVKLASNYLRAIAWGLLPALWLVPLRGLLEGVSRTGPIMLISFVAVGFNILANNALMYGRWGFPKLGLVGTGYASSLAFSLSFLLLALYISRGFGRYQIFSRLRSPDPMMMRDLLVIGVPIALTLGFEVGMFSTVGFLMGLLGKAELAAQQIAMQTASVTFMVPLGLSVATSIRVGQAIGQGDRVASRRAGYTGIAISALFMCFTALTFWFAPRFIIGLYLDLSLAENAEVISLATSFFAIAAMFQLFDGFQVSAAGALRGLKDTQIPMFITLLSYWIVGVGSGVWFCFGLGLAGRGLWFGLVCGLATAAVLLTWRFYWLMSDSVDLRRLSDVG